MRIVKSLGSFLSLPNVKYSAMFHYTAYFLKIFNNNFRLVPDNEETYRSKSVM